MGLSASDIVIMQHKKSLIRIFSQKQAFFYQFFWADLEVLGVPKTLKIQGFSKFVLAIIFRHQLQIRISSSLRIHRHKSPDSPSNHQAQNTSQSSSHTKFSLSITTPLRPEQSQSQIPDLSTILKIATNTHIPISSAQPKNLRIPQIFPPLRWQ